MKRQPRPERRAELALLRRGEATVSEAAELAGVSRQLVHAWCRVAGIDAIEKRRARLAKLWRRAQPKE